ncbi:hypothetical protein JK635_07525 [Neobacillus sp. YIM B02564]|uniref:Tetrahydromethanopterin S-methyltransferase n=1 Tax=Neobacillus paridis TaxID=2803862 RepID=A0ABS1TL60_9BACI|nr:hypothetical protein [Neobacillus paridis]MBL4952059.1 hypothetical protein [Neobacillus paridis]
MIVRNIQGIQEKYEEQKTHSLKEVMQDIVHACNDGRFETFAGRFTTGLFVIGLVFAIPVFVIILKFLF